jgi:hypothetical protein
MKVTVTVGETTRETEVPDGLVRPPGSLFTDLRQDAALASVAQAFTEAYIAEARRAPQTPS